MSLSPLLEEPFLVTWHAFAAFAAIVLGAIQLIAPKGTTRHRILGYGWAALMLWIAASSFWIHDLRIVGRWSPIHLLSIVVLVTVPLAVWHAHRHRVRRHRSAMISLFVLALVVTGFFTFWPGRTMHAVLFGS